MSSVALPEFNSVEHNSQPSFSVKLFVFSHVNFGFDRGNETRLERAAQS